MKFSSQHKQLSLDLIKSSLEELPKDNRWVRLGDSLPWDEIERIYNSKLNNKHGGAGNKPARLVIGALIIKHKMGLSDEETIEAIRENPYMQYMVGLSEFTDKPIFDASLFVVIRKRLGVEDFNGMSESVLREQVRLQHEREPHDKVEEHDDTNPASGESDSTSLASDTRVKTHVGLLKIDATCCDAEMRYPTDLDLVHDGLKVVDRITERICEQAGMEKPDTHLKALHSKYMNVIKLRSKSKRKIHGCMEYLLTWLYRNIRTCLSLIAGTSTTVFEGLKPRERKLFTTVLKMYHQQKEMFSCGVHRCPERIVSIFQPHIRPIVRGKAKAKVEFGAKIGATL